MAGESDLVSWIRSQQSPAGIVQLAAGDDLAILQWPANDLLLVGCDQVLDGVHFDSRVHPPHAIGRKAMNRNLSDCAAMACLPAAALVSVALPRGTPMEFAKELYLGIKEAGDKFNCPIVGGETGAWDGKLAVTVTIFGRSAGAHPTTRSGAKPGDLVYVTGSLGGSLLGRHMEFMPQVDLARQLTEKVSAMIDLSDGLSRDLRHICDQSGVGAIIEAAKVPVHDDAIEMRRDGHSPLEHALHDGEDYELLFTSRADRIDFPFIRRIGIMTTDRSIVLVHADGHREPLEPKGWEHTF
jgi:thiamine-monophosphate kinase